MSCNCNKDKGISETILHGAMGLTKAILHMDQAPHDIITHRRKLCKSCEYHSNHFCKECGCLIAAKTTLKTEKCPKSYW